MCFYSEVLLIVHFKQKIKKGAGVEKSSVTGAVQRVTCQKDRFPKRL